MRKIVMLLLLALLAAVASAQEALTPATVLQADAQVILPVGAFRLNSPGYCEETLESGPDGARMLSECYILPRSPSVTIHTLSAAFRDAGYTLDEEGVMPSGGATYQVWRGTLSVSRAFSFTVSYSDFASDPVSTLLLVVAVF